MLWPFNSVRTYVRGRAIGALSALTLCGILVAGLWPFHSPKNQIRWLGRETGLVFGDYGTILSSRMFEGDSLDGPSCTLEIWLEPASAWKAGTVLSFYNPLNRRQLLLQQNYADLVLQRDTGDEHQQTILNVAQVFQREQAFITIASDGRDTAVYVDGNLVKLLPRVKLSLNDLTGQLIVGTSPLQSNSWPGRLRGLAIYKSELTAGRVARHYEEWAHDGKPAVIANERTLALYLFDERTGKIAHDQEKPGDDLYIPERYLVVDQLLLERPWAEFATQKSYLKNVFINVCGFVPLGFFFAAYFTSARQIKHATLSAIVLGGLVSLTIEVLQAYLPTRDSGVTDLITNTFGTGVGVALYRAAALSLAASARHKTLSLVLRNKFRRRPR